MSDRSRIHAGFVDGIKRIHLPYGLWVCENGREVLFDRSYRPLLERSASDATVELANGDEWIKGIKNTAWFYSDGTPEPEKRKNAIAALKKWGVVA